MKPTWPTPCHSRAVLTTGVRAAGVGYDKLAGKWHMPFIMQIVNTRVVRRSNFFNHYGEFLRLRCVSVSHALHST